MFTFEAFEMVSFCRVCYLFFPTAERRIIEICTCGDHTHALDILGTLQGLRIIRKHATRREFDAPAGCQSESGRTVFQGLWDLWFGVWRGHRLGWLISVFLRRSRLSICSSRFWPIRSPFHENNLTKTS